MAYNWKVLRAAVLQEILFPSEDVFDTYIQSLDRKKFSYEVENKTKNADGTVTVLMRKRYNPHNAFLPKEG